MKKSECYRVPSPSPDQFYSYDSESEEEEFIETHYRQTNNNEDIASALDSIPPTPLEVMSPLPVNNTLEDEIADPEILESHSNPPEDLTHSPWSNKPPSCTTPSTRPRRTIRLPSRFRDFEM